MNRFSIAALGLAGAFAVATPAIAAKGHDKQAERNRAITEAEAPDQTCNFDGPGGSAALTIEYGGTTSIWPPNHKSVDDALVITWSLVDDGSDDNGMTDGALITFTAGHSQYDAETGEEAKGSGNTPGDSDITPQAGSIVLGSWEEEVGETSATQSFTVRAERAGTDRDGRIYTVSGTAQYVDADGDDADDDSGSCDFELQTYVPHDQGNKNNGGNPYAG